MKRDNLTIGQRVFGVYHGRVTTGTIINLEWIGEGPNAVMWDHIKYGPGQFSINLDDAVATRDEAEQLAREYHKLAARMAARRIQAEINQRVIQQCMEDWEALYSEAWALTNGDVDECDFVEHAIQGEGPTKLGFRMLRDFIKSRKNHEDREPQ